MNFSKIYKTNAMLHVYLPNALVAMNNSHKQAFCTSTPTAYNMTMIITPATTANMTEDKLPALTPPLTGKPQHSLA